MTVTVCFPLKHDVRWENHQEFLWIFPKLLQLLHQQRWNTDASSFSSCVCSIEGSAVCFVCGWKLNSLFMIRVFPAFEIKLNSTGSSNKSEPFPDCCWKKTHWSNISGSLGKIKCVNSPSLSRFGQRRSKTGGQRWSEVTYYLTKSKAEPETHTN